MPIYLYKCLDCEHISKLFNNEKLQCEECNSTNLKKTISNPLKNTNLERVDKYRKIDNIPELKKSLRKRHVQHTEKILPDLIDKHGKEIAIEQGWIDPKTGKISDKWKEKK